ncbi:Ribosomal protein L31, mitochondrial [Kalmanozyma brasiliensis GHG001]|uniref:Putative MRPL31-mitochondrial ribosomal protein, large subunit n=1 Tax=Kalmanozyma brasiliensis (strain GHG001) TaxID=1365824 RepID=V5ES56_KALBG|nr:Ribosomal protein L31, mitochondrial [Kalmanozyma brasiliensis GHG001]EST04709.1 Ribosomal protein L31, mitochondrial [Kalmanozyma brasiliensis GHG001]
MFGGAFKPSLPSLGGLLWKNPWRLSATRKSRVRTRLRAVDDVIATLTKSNVECHALQRALALPREEHMLAKDKYTTFSKHDRGFRKSVHKVPKWTRLTIRENPVGY